MNDKKEMAPDVARDPDVIEARNKIFDACSRYVLEYIKYAGGNEDSETEMLHIESYDLYEALNDKKEASQKFYQKNPTGVVQQNG